MRPPYPTEITLLLAREHAADLRNAWREANTSTRPESRPARVGPTPTRGHLVDRDHGPVRGKCPPERSAAA